MAISLGSVAVRQSEQVEGHGGRLARGRIHLRPDAHLECVARSHFSPGRAGMHSYRAEGEGRRGELTGQRRGEEEEGREEKRTEKTEQDIPEPQGHDHLLGIAGRWTALIRRSATP